MATATGKTTETGRATPSPPRRMTFTSAMRQGSAVVLTAALTANGFASSIFVSEGANVNTNEFKLDATADVYVSDLDSDIFIETGGELEADDVFIQNQAEIEMSGGLLDVNDLTIDDGTQLQGVSAGAISVDVLQLSGEQRHGRFNRR